MKSFILILSIFLLTENNNLIGQNFDFRNTQWGMDSLQVKKIEKSKKINISKKLAFLFDGKLADLDAKIFYEFSALNQLYHTKYFIDLDNKSTQSYVDNFLLLQKSLTEKYKEPVSKKAIALDGSAVKDNKWVSALNSYNMSLETVWKTDKTVITLSLFCVKNELVLTLNYISIEYEKKIEEEKRIQLLKDI